MVIEVYTNNNGAVPVTCDEWDYGRALDGMCKVIFTKNRKFVAWFNLSNINGFKVISEVEE